MHTRPLVVVFVFLLFLVTARPASSKEKAGRTDAHGDPLPPGAVARLGTIRLRHGDSIRALAFSPDGKTLASLGYDRHIRLWDTASGCEQAHVEGDFQTLAFSGKGRTLTTTTKDGELAVWNLRGEKIRTVRRFAGGFYCSALSRDGTRLAAPDDGMTLLLCDAAAGEVRHRIKTEHTNSIVTLTFSPSGKRLASTSLSSDAVRVWDTIAGRQLAAIEDKRYTPPVAFSADDKILAGGGSKGRVELWEAASGKSIGVRNCPRGLVASLAWACEGRTLVGSPCFPPYGLVIWNASSDEQRTLEVPGRMEVLAFSPGDKLLAAAGFDNTIHLFDLSSGKERFADRGHGGPVQTVQFTADQRGLLTAAPDGTLRLWDLASGRQRRRFSLPSGSPRAFAFTTVGRTLLVHVEYPTAVVHRWDLETAALIRSFAVRGQRWNGDGVAFSPDGTCLVTAEPGPVLAVWDTAAGKKLRSLEPRYGKEGVNPMPAHSLAYSPDGRRLAASIERYGGTKLHLWDLASGKERLPRQEKYAVVVLPLFSADGKVLIARQDRFVERDRPPFVRLWEVESGLPRRLELKGTGAVGAFAVSADGEILATAEGWRIRLWDLLREEEIGHFDGHRGAINTLAFSADTHTLLSGSADTTALIWDIKDLAGKRKRRVTNLTRRQFDALWSDLGDKDAGRAGDSLRQLIVARQTVAFLREQLHPVAALPAGRIERLIAQLDSDEFAEREQASQELIKLADCALPRLRKTLADHPTLEMRRRIEDILARQPDIDLRLLRATEVLEHIGSDEARQVLQTLADGAEEARLTREARASLRRLK